LIERELDSARLDAAWLARLSKLNSQRGISSDSNTLRENSRPSGWWSFHVVSRDV
jgi:hypothetical protein